MERDLERRRKDLDNVTFIITGIYFGIRKFNVIRITLIRKIKFKYLNRNLK
jgi:hypothetical protein